MRTVEKPTFRSRFGLSAALVLSLATLAFPATAGPGPLDDGTPDKGGWGTDDGASSGSAGVTDTGGTSNDVTLSSQTCDASTDPEGCGGEDGDFRDNAGNSGSADGTDAGGDDGGGGQDGGGSTHNASDGL